MARDRNEVYADILAMPERDDLRLEYAAVVRGSDPGWARYIERAVTENEYLEPPPDCEERLKEPFQHFGRRVGCLFHRGFVHRIVVEPGTFLAHGNALLDLAPIIEVSLQVINREGPQGDWSDFLPAIAQCSALSRVRHLTISGTPRFDHQSLLYIIRSQHTDRLLALTPRNGIEAPRDPDQAAAEEGEVFAALFASATFRRMIDWGLRHYEEPRQLGETTRGLCMSTRRQIGDRMRVFQRRMIWQDVSYEPMPAEDRALEQQYGYIPQLHASNWGRVGVAGIFERTTVLDVLRGKKPDYPAGAPVTEEMYSVPAPEEIRLPGEDVGF